MENQNVTSEEKIFSAIGYIGILFLIPLVLKRDSAFAQHHAKNGLVLFLAWVISWVVGIIPVLGWIAAFFFSIFLIVLTILGVIKALAGEMWEMPYLSKYVKKLKI